MSANTLAWAAVELIKRASGSDSDSDSDDTSQREISTAWSLTLLICLLIAALFASYILQTRRIQAIHETVLSILAGMVIGLILRLAAPDAVLKNVSFDYQMFFNLLLPPIILASGFELHQTNFFRNIGSILTFAFAGTFISAVVLGLILFLWTRLKLDNVNIDFIDAMMVGATLSATDPVTILAIFNAYKVDPKLYTIIFGESILNDAIAIVLFETAKEYKSSGHKMGFLSLFEATWSFIFVFFGSLIIGLVIGMMTSLLLKFTYLRRNPKIESAIVVLIAYASYFFSTAISMSGIVSLLFCAICMKHYAYYNMSRRTQLASKFVFQLTAQLSENFIFIYLGLSLFTERNLGFNPLFILITVIGICVARWCSVFPLSHLINMVIRYRAKRLRKEAEEIPQSHQVMLFWAGLRGAVGVALAAGFVGASGPVLRATVLVVVVLTVIIFGGTTARMLDILNIKTGVVEEIDSDDEFDIEYVSNDQGIFSRKSGTGFGHNPRRASSHAVALGNLEPDELPGGAWSTSNGNGHSKGAAKAPRQTNSGRGGRGRDVRRDAVERGLLSPDSGSASQVEDSDTAIVDDDDFDFDAAADLDLPPAARRIMSMHGAGGSPATSSPAAQSPRRPRTPTPAPQQGTGRAESPYPTSGVRATPPRGASVTEVAHNVGGRIVAATGVMTQLISGLSEDPAEAFRQIDEDFIKPHLLLDPGSSGGGHNGQV